MKGGNKETFDPGGVSMMKQHHGKLHKQPHEDHHQEATRSMGLSTLQNVVLNAQPAMDK